MDALPPFNPDSALRRGTVSVVIGHRNAGKSWLTRDLLTRSLGTAQPPTGGLWIGYEPHLQMPTGVAQHSEEFSPELLRSFLQNHRDSSAGSFIVYDNCIHDSTVFAMPAFRATLQNSRTWNLRITVTMLYAMGIPPALRACVDFVFIFREGIASNARRIADSWFTGYDLEHVRQLLQEPYRSDHDCLVLDTRTDQLYRYCVLPARPTAGLVPSLPSFDLTTIRPGDLCIFRGAGYKTPVACAIIRAAMAQNPQMAAGYLEPRETIVPLATGNYASICHRVAVYATQYPRAAALANFLLDVSGPSFVMLDDNWFDTRALPYEFLWAHRRERQTLVVSGIHCSTEDPPDFQFFFHPGARHTPHGLPPEISADWLWDLDYFRHECIVLDTRTRHVSRFML
jgi:hypothetical protein